MLSLGPILPLAFTAPWILLGLATLPVIWWLLRITPPTPRRVPFPPIRILLGLSGEEETPAKTPLWLALLRLLLAALAVLALAHPLLHPNADLSGDGPVLLVIDDGWAAAPNWPLRQKAALALVEQAKRQQRPVMILTTAPLIGGGHIRASGLLQPAEAEPILRALQPKPWATDRHAAAIAAEDLSFTQPPSVVWLGDGIDGPGRKDLATNLAAHLKTLGPSQKLQLAQQPLSQRAMALLPPTLTAQGLATTVLRAGDLGLASVTVHAIGERGRVLGQGTAQFLAGDDRAVAEIPLPGELRNRALRLDLIGPGSAAASILLDERWRRRPVGLVSGGGVEARSQPLLSNLYYLERALSPFAELRHGDIDSLLQRPLAVMALADIGRLSGSEQTTLSQWVKDGGMLIRFAGPHLAQTSEGVSANISGGTTDDLLPTPLRQGGRDLGGSLSWAKPAGLAAFPKHSPFFGLDIPGDVLIRRQVLAQPSQDLSQHTWASLVDGTPLVTAAPRGQGWLVLFHTTANAAWSNLPLSGLFVEMMRRLTDMSRGVGNDGGEAGDAKGVGRELPPLASLDGFGRLGPPPSGAELLAARDIAKAKAGPRSPPGYYGLEEDRRALNLSQNWQALHAITELSVPARLTGYQHTNEFDLKPWLLAAAVVLALIDLLAVLALRGLLRPSARLTALILGALILGPLLLLPNTAPKAQQLSAAEKFAMAAALDTRLAYVITGDARVDEMSRAGLAGLSEILRLRTSIEPEAPMAVDIERAPLMLFPILYWPMVASQPPLSERAIAKVSQFMRTGGTIVLDSRDGGSSLPALRRQLGLTGGSSAGRLRDLLSRLDIPPLAPVPQGHVLTKSFYLSQGFPGRYTGGTVWVERRPGGVNDGVSALVVGGNDWAAAWATDLRHKPLVLPTPGGSRQREMAYRFGVNLVMYAMTGNYKADQVHIRDILERLGQ